MFANFHTMDASHLISSELSYELRIRNLIDSGNRDEKRKLLRGILSRERYNPDISIAIDTSKLVFAEEVTQINESIKDLSEQINTFQGSRTDASAKRFNSRILHVIGRSDRLPCVDPEQEKIKENLTRLCLILEGELSEKLDKPDVQVGNSSSTPVGLRLHSTVNPSQINRDTKAVPVYKWGLLFNGSSGSVCSFLERIEELSLARNMSKNELFLGAADLFTGPALIWYRSIKDKIQDWDSLTKELKTQFLPHNYEDFLWEEIKQRTQGPNEKVGIFLASLENLFNRLPTVPTEEVKLKYMKRNVLPYFANHLALKEIQSTADLLKFCHLLEGTRESIERYRPPPTRRNDLLEPDLAYAGTSYMSNPTVCTMGVLRKGSFKRKNPVKCWNCNAFNHSYRDCSKPKTIFCYGCGKKGVTKGKCPKCSVSKNAVTGSVFTPTGEPF